MDCSRSCLVTFPPAIYTTSGVDDIVPELVRGLPADIKCLQFLSQGKVRITLGCADSALKCFEDGVHFKGSRLPVQSADPRARLVYVRDCPSEVSDASVRELLAPYGVVRRVVQVPHNKFPKISTGTRKVTMSVTKEIPSILRVAGFDCRVWYAGQPSVCPICRKPGHRVKQCPDHGKCRRCHQPGHVARQCRRAWGAAPAAPSGSSARPEATSSIPAPAPAARPAEPLIVEMESCSESESSLVAGDLEVAASAPPGPVSPRRTRSKGKARSPKPLEDRVSQVAGEQHSAPAPELGMSPPAMALSPERPDTHLLHSHREVWEDKLQWEEIRSMKLQSGVVESSQEPSSTPMLFESTPPPSVSSVPSQPRETPVSQDTGGPPPQSTIDDSAVAASVAAPHRDLRCPLFIWDLIDGEPLAPELVPHFRHWRHRLGDCQGDVPLSVQQRRTVLELIAEGLMFFHDDAVLVPFPF